MAKKKGFIVEICPNLLKDWNKNSIFNKTVQITKTNINLVTNKLSIFCDEDDHNCFCDERVMKNSNITKVFTGSENGKT